LELLYATQELELETADGLCSIWHCNYSCKRLQTDILTEFGQRYYNESTPETMLTGFVAKKKKKKIAVFNSGSF